VRLNLFELERKVGAMKTEEEFWKRKLLAFLHDPRSKALDLALHGEQSAAAMKRAGFIDPETQTTGQGEAAVQIYTAYYLRLRDEFRMGLVAEAYDKQQGIALNWHGDPNAPDFGKTIKNRRSTLLGEKGHGLGVCGTWDFYPGA